MNEFQNDIKGLYKQIGYKDFNGDGKLESPVTVELPQVAIDRLNEIGPFIERDYFTEDGVIELAIGNYEPNELLPDKPSKEFLEWLDPDGEPFERHVRHVKMILATIYPVKLEKEG
jgi:hypothetical protein